MANLWRLVWVNAARTAELGRIMCNFPEATNNTGSNVSKARYGTAAALSEAVVNDTYITSCNLSNILYFHNSQPIYDGFPAAGFNNHINMSQLEVGQRFYIGRWDANHSYIEIVSKVDNNSSGWIGFTYYCYDGVQLTSRTITFTNVSNASGVIMIPWFLDVNYENWSSASEASLYDDTLTLYRTGNPIGFGLSIARAGNLNLDLAKKFLSRCEVLDGDNPYSEAGYTEEDGGDPVKQNWANTSDAITPDGLPTKGAVASGMLKVFSPSDTQVANLVDLMFSYNFFDWLQKNLQNLEELFVSFGTVPFTVTKGSTQSVTFLGFDISSFTHPVTLTEAAEQFYEIDMGSIALNGTDDRIHASNSVFDYSPFSKLGIYLPFVGYQELDIDECRGNTINLKYRVDIVSGSCVALISLNSDKDRCLYQFSGNCLSQIPLGSVDMSSIVQGSINIAVALASAGSTAAVSSAGDAFATEQADAGKLSDAGKNLGSHQRGAQVANAVSNLNSATVNGIMGMKPHFKHSGAIGSTGGQLAVKQPYLFLTTPREAVPKSYQKYCGFPCNITDKLGNFSGYTVVEDIRLNGLVATSPEVEEIYNLLKSGVIV